MQREEGQATPVNSYQEFFSKVYQGFKTEFETREFLGLVLNLDQFKNIYQAILVSGIYLGVSALIATIFQPLAYLGAIIAFGMGIYSLFSAAVHYAEPEKAKQMVIESAYCFGGYLALSFMPVFLSLVAVGSILYKSYDIFPHKDDIKQGLKTAWTGFKSLFSQVEEKVDSALGVEGAKTSNI